MLTGEYCPNCNSKTIHSFPGVAVDWCDNCGIIRVYDLDGAFKGTPKIARISRTRRFINALVSAFK